MIEPTTGRWHRWWRSARFVAVETAASVGSLALGIVALLALPLLLFAGSWLIVPRLVTAIDRWAHAARVRSSEYLRRPAPPARPQPSLPLTASEGMRTALTRSTGREIGWLIVHGLPMMAAGLVALVIPLGVPSSLVTTFSWQLAPADDPVVSLFPVTSWATAAWMPVVALGYALVAWLLVPAVATGSAWLTERMLVPSRRGELSARVDVLTASRAAALDAHAAELQRIERDLHDGAQNRLVGVVMMLGLAKRAVQTGDERAVEHLERAQQAATDALAGLRSTVHDIYPPVLADLGLAGALSALAGRSGVPCELDAEEVPRMPAAVEAALYFAVAESLTNTAKYADAEHVVVRVRHDQTANSVSAEVCDDGIGGASARPGGGLAGIARRTAAFEGVFHLSSPVGGPTTMRVELPCGS